MNKISLLQFILQGIGTVTVYYLMIRFFNWFMDTLSDIKEKYTRLKNDFSCLLQNTLVLQTTNYMSKK